VTKFGRDGGLVVIRFDADEVVALQDLGGQVAGILGGGVPEHGSDPIRDRLFPRAYLDPTEDRAETDFQSIVHDDLVRAKADAVAEFLAALGGNTDGRGRLSVKLDSKGVEQWVGALNDVRLAIGVAIGVTEDDDESFDPDDPRAAGLAAYHWLTWLQGTLVGVLLEERE
jgi:hypothetical protein